MDAATHQYLERHRRLNGLTLLQSHTRTNSVEEQRSPKVFSVSIDRVNLLIVEGVVRLRLENTRKYLPFKHTCDLVWTFLHHQQ